MNPLLLSALARGFTAALFAVGAIEMWKAFTEEKKVATLPPPADLPPNPPPPAPPVEDPAPVVADLPDPAVFPVTE